MLTLLSEQDAPKKVKYAACTSKRMKLGLPLCTAELMFSIFLQSESATVQALQVTEMFTELGQDGFKDKSSKWA